MVTAEHNLFSLKREKSTNCKRNVSKCKEVHKTGEVKNNDQYRKLKG